MSFDGPRDLARVSATCKTLMKVARQSDVLRAVNFERLTFRSDHTMHHHRNDLLCRCARAGNLAAETILGKALLMRDTWFWNMVFDNDQPALIENGASNGVLRHQQLVRSYIRHASSEDIIKMNLPLLSYMNTFVGYDTARSFGMLYAITRMCSYEVIRLRVSSVSCTPVNAQNYASFRALNDLLAQLTPPPGLTHRDIVLAIFDRLFPPTPV
ncbi:hypothetical protein L6452_36851 [Arctium lappa]|uniref:Uncharacterized protein n=1 Tax=Arctium lappa TaxID=4217 RepID=A0ACB8Y1V7_ARCLA|nr:hypothetical protein L6452_36851 [Arctium lappa]